jgi:hypothetical protein
MSVVITFMGIFYFAVILALIVDWVRGRMDSIKKGKGFIVEDGHFLILGACPPPAGKAKPPYD